MQRVEQVRSIFEKHKTLISLTATLGSTLAAFAGYQARQSHMKKLEEQLQEIRGTLHVEKEVIEKTNAMVRKSTWNDYKYV